MWTTLPFRDRRTYVYKALVAYTQPPIRPIRCNAESLRSIVQGLQVLEAIQYTFGGPRGSHGDILGWGRECVIGNPGGPFLLDASSLRLAVNLRKVFKEQCVEKDGGLVAGEVSALLSLDQIVFALDIRWRGA
jgi:hypothetical protein